MTAPRSNDRGAALIETALLAPVFFVLVLGIIEAGYLFRDYQITSDSVSDGSRIGALMGPSMADDGSSPDYQIIRALRDATGSMGPDWVERIVVFKGTAPSGSGGGSAESQVPALCRNGTPVAGSCNVYNDPIAAFSAVEEGDTGYFACPGSTVSCSWPPLNRSDGPTVDAIEYVGVWMRVERPYLTGMFGSVLTLEQASVTRIEVGALTG